MDMMPKKKAFDCVAMKRQAQEIIRADLQGKSREEEIAYFNAGAEEFRQRIEAAKQAAARAAMGESDGSAK